MGIRSQVTKALRGTTKRVGQGVAPRTNPTILVIGDAHAKPGESNERFHLAGEYARHIQADIVLQIGDWFDMESLSSYDKGKKSFEGRRYDLDIRAGRDATEQFEAGIKGWTPKLKVALGGNHGEGRIKRVVNDNPELDGTLSEKDFGWDDYGWEYVPFLTPRTIEGVTFNHFFASGVMGRPIGGVNQARSMLNKLHRSTVAGHSHLFDYAEQTCIDGSKIQAVVAGCFFEHEESYAGQQVNQMWWRGLTRLENVKNGEFDIGRIDMNRLKRGDW